MRASFVPPKPQRQLRTLTRYRKTQIAERQREANRLHKALEDTGIKLDCVATDILGMSGRAMLDALVAGTTDPHVLADLARGRLRAKIPALREALEGRFEAHHALVIGAILAHLDFLDEQIDRLSAGVGRRGTTSCVRRAGRVRSAGADGVRRHQRVDPPSHGRPARAGRASDCRARVRRGAVARRPCAGRVRLRARVLL